MLKITRLRHAYPEKPPFCIDRKAGYSQYTLLHFHNSMEMIIDGKQITTVPNAVILYDIGFPQYFRSFSPIVHDWMHFVGDATELFELCGIKLNEIYYPDNCSFITELIAEMETEFYGNRQNREALLDVKINELFLKLGRAISKDRTVDYNFETQQKFRYLRGKMFSSLQEQWSVADMAKEVNLSQPRVFAIYKDIFGISPKSDLINARINSAKNMLSFTNKRIDDIAAELGYLEKTHFTRQFKKITGLSPTHYRRKQNSQKNS